MREREREKGEEGERDEGETKRDRGERDQENEKVLREMKEEDKVTVFSYLYCCRDVCQELEDAWSQLEAFSTSKGKRETEKKKQCYFERCINFQIFIFIFSLKE